MILTRKQKYAWNGIELAQKDLQGSKIEARELQGGTKNYSAQWGIIEIPSRQINDLYFSKKTWKNWVSGQTWPRAWTPKISGISEPPAGRIAASLGKQIRKRSNCSFTSILPITHPIAIPSLRTTRCQYSVATPVSAPLTLNSRTHAESNLGLWIQSANIPINIPAVVNTAMNIVPANTMYLKGIPRNVQYVMHFCAQWDNASLTK